MAAVLLVDDERPKRERLATIISSALGNTTKIVAVESVRSAIKAARSERFDIALVDMSLPTFDSLGGRPQGFGGLEVMRYLQNEDRLPPSIVVTAYGEFSTGEEIIFISELKNKLRAEFGDLFIDLIHYNTMYSEWQSDLESVLRDWATRSLL